LYKTLYGFAHGCTRNPKTFRKRNFGKAGASLERTA
jgi:hypothetical protein